MRDDYDATAKDQSDYLITMFISAITAYDSTSLPAAARSARRYRPL